jgi:lysophospholipase L1-like esterase
MILPPSLREKPTMRLPLLRLLAASAWLLAAPAPAAAETPAAEAPAPEAPAPAGEPAAPVAAPPLKVMAFGDSLTLGIGSTHGAGYRLAFLERMREAGVEVDMVGSLNDGPKDMDGDHEAFGGEGIAKLDRVSLDELRKRRPDVVLVMVGTNDTDGFVPEAFRIRYSVLLDRIVSESRVRLLVATIPPTRFDKRKRGTEAINSIVRSEVAKRAAEGKAIRLVDVHALIDARADFADNLHLNDAAYERVGHAFADALLAMPPPTARAAYP